MDKTAKKKSPELLIGKNKDDDWKMSENGRETQAPASDISQHFSETEVTRPKKLPEMSSGEPSSDNYELGFDAEGESSRVHGKDFRKKSNRAVDNVPDLGSADQNKDLDGALYSGSNELVYEL